MTREQQPRFSEHRGEPQRLQFTLLRSSQGGLVYLTETVPMRLSDTPGYTEFVNPTKREIMHHSAKSLATFIHDNNINSTIYPDLSARGIRHGISTMWKKIYPREEQPNAFFVNPQALATRGELSDKVRETWDITTGNKPLPESLEQEEIGVISASELLQTMADGCELLGKLNNAVSLQEIARISTYDSDRATELLYRQLRLNGIPPYYASDLARSGFLTGIIQLAKKVDIFSNQLELARSKDEILAEFEENYPGLMKNKNGKVAIIDTCIHDGEVMYPLMRRLSELGFSQVQIAVIDSGENRSAIVPDHRVFSTNTTGGCYYFGREEVAVKVEGAIRPSTIFVGKTQEEKRKEVVREPVKQGRKMRSEISRIIAEEYHEFSVERDSVVVDKLQRRLSAGKNLDILSLDLDGTLYFIDPERRANIGPNQVTAQQIGEKILPVIINTARPEWSSDTDFEVTKQIGFALPDVVIADDGTQVKWRGKDGLLHDDPEYTSIMGDHRVTFNDTHINRQFNAEHVYKNLSPLLDELIPDANIVEVIQNEADILSYGAFGLSSLRVVLQNTSYQMLNEFNIRMHEHMSGVKMQLSELSSHSTDELFTGWIHFVPSIAGKDRALRYVLSKMNGIVGEEITAHAVGDSSIDIPALTMGTYNKGSDQSDGYHVLQYAVGNIPPRVRRKLERITSVDPSKLPAKRAHLQILNQQGPDGVYEVVNSIE